MTIDLKLFHRTFFEESLEGLSQMESGLLSLQNGEAPTDVVNAVFRAAHSIKGGAGTFGFTAIAQLTHGMETLLDEVRDGRRVACGELVDLLLWGVDVLGVLLRNAQDGLTTDPEQTAAVRGALDAMIATRDVATAPAPVVVDTAVGTGIGFTVQFRPHRELFASGNDPYRLFRELQSLGECHVQVHADELPAFDIIDPESAYLHWTVTLHSATVTPAQITEVFEWVADECVLTMTRLGAESELRLKPEPTVDGQLRLKPEPTADGQRRLKPEPTSSIRVKTEKIDALINLVGELVITQSMLGELGQNFDMSRLEALRTGLAQLERNTRELQENVIGIRMMPVGLAFSRFPRMVHDIGRQLGKQVQITLSGEQTELDKTVIEKIGDPLVHLVRNALDHGIELPESRMASGKPAQGTLTLNAFHRGGQIFIEISDDGAGLDKARIRLKAESRGLMNAGDEISDARLYDLIFEPGFSTADAVSDLSGRGVGMDVVRRNIKELGGTVDVRTQAGRGTTFTIRLPLTLAILDGQLLRIAGQTFVAPLVSMIETVRIKTELVGTVAGHTEVYRLRDEYLPILRPHRLFALPRAEAALADSLLMVVEAEGRRVGVVVDELTAQQQVVIKSLESNFRPVPGLSGATILGDGTVALILDVAGLIGLGLDRGDLAGQNGRLANAA